MSRKNWNKESIINHIENIMGYRFIRFIEFNKSNSIVEVECKKGHRYQVNFNSLRKGRKCRKCSGSMKYSINEIKGYLQKFDYKLLSNEYIDNKHKIKIQCPKGHVFEMRFNNFVRGIRCPECNKSNGEEEIERILTKYEINVIFQYRFKDCKFYNILPFDFYLPNYNCCIEFDGEQHYEIVKHFGGLNGFIERKIRDTIKTEYCKNNNIKLIRIPYWEINNIETILTNELIKLKTS